MIAIVNYGMGNLRSVHKALEHVGLTTTVTDSPREIKKSSALVVPGVGAFGDCINNLSNSGLLAAIKEFLNGNKPYLGICLGMQILFAGSAEAPGIKGLGILPGTVKKFPAGLKIPHMGWNQIKVKNGECAKPETGNYLLKDIPDNSYMYFVHSYYPAPSEKTVVAAETDYGISFSSMINKGNIWACQFHPEKSQQLGLQILKNFKNLCS